MKSNARKILSTLLAFVLVFGLFTGMPPLTATATDAADLADQINDFFPHGDGALSAAASGSTVTVTGTVTNAIIPLKLDIDANVTVIWKAMYSGKSDTDGQGMINLKGGGTFEVAEGGSIVQTEGLGVNLWLADTVVLKVAGGTVSSTGNEPTIYSANEMNQNIKVSGGTVENTGTGAAICSEAENAAITVSGGTVKATGANGIAIHTKGENSVVTVDGGVVGSTKYWAIFNEGKAGTITVNNGTVSAKGINGRAIRNAGEQSKITVNGGTVECADEGIALANATDGKKSVITVNSGVVTATGVNSTAIYNSGADSEVAIYGGVVESVFCGIFNDGANSKITIDGGVVTAMDGHAVSSESTNSSVTVSDGFVFAYGTSINGTGGDTVIRIRNGLLTISGTGIVCAYDPASLAETYDEGTITEDIIVMPETATVTWGKSGSKNGIRYANGSNTGFLQVSGVTVNTATLPSPMTNFVKSKVYVVGMFSDVDENAWYGYNNQKVVANAYEYSLMEGNSATTFNPSGNITLAEAITVAARVRSIYSTGQPLNVVSEPWYSGYVDYAIDNGIIVETTFTDYNRTATRGEMAYIFSRALPENEFIAHNTVNALPDVKSSTPYYNAIIMLYEAGVLAGNDDAGTFSPEKNITRTEAAAIISRVIIPSTRFNGKVFE